MSWIELVLTLQTSCVWTAGHLLQCCLEGLFKSLGPIHTNRINLLDWSSPTRFLYYGLLPAVKSEYVNVRRMPMGENTSLRAEVTFNTQYPRMQDYKVLEASRLMTKGDGGSPTISQGHGLETSRYDCYTGVTRPPTRPPQSWLSDAITQSFFIVLQARKQPLRPTHLCTGWGKKAPSSQCKGALKGETAIRELHALVLPDWVGGYAYVAVVS